MLPERDIQTPSRNILTLVNPDYMGHKVYELEREISPVRSHLTSLNLLRPENAPDSWEIDALKAFEKGRTEVSSIIKTNGEDYMRFMRPLAVEESC